VLGAVAGLQAARGDVDDARVDARRALESLEHAAPEAMFVLIQAAGSFAENEGDRVVRLARLAARSGNDVAVATEALVLAIRSARFGEAADARLYGRQAAIRYDALGWPLLEARALEVADDVARARLLYERCGASACARRLGATLPGLSTDALAALSSRESQIAALLGSGLTNGEIAKRLNIAGKTVEKHVSSVFGKLGLRSRSQVAALVAGAASRGT
jgi:DNA-binding NarL/FixJ family response regulator